MNAHPLPQSRTVKSYSASLLQSFLCFSFCLGSISFAQEQKTPWPEEEAEALTRGPVHEAFAATISYNPEAGPLVSKEPPAPIEEQAPELKPEGTNIVWLSGYWAWDDERDNFLWISGVWRDIPPGRQWIPGYWNSTDSGFQWISGYWATLTSSQPKYLPEPPSSLENGPNVAIPSDDYVWVPGVWVWQGRYVWRPGYWIQGRPDLSWIPDSYVWTPHGYIYVDGYWDYPVARRGVLFAPVYWHSPVYVRQRYYYRPSVVISLSIFSDCLFVRPRYRHYYFGDYYSPVYRQSGFYASISFGSNRRGYDPIYRHQRWENRHNRDWEVNVRRTYEVRRSDVSARPPRSFAEQRNRSTQPGTNRTSSSVIATPLAEVSGNRSGTNQFRKISPGDNEKQMKEIRQARQNATDRQKNESRTLTDNTQPERTQADRPLSRERQNNPSSRSDPESAAQAGSDRPAPRAQEPAGFRQRPASQREFPKPSSTANLQKAKEENKDLAQQPDFPRNTGKESRPAATESTTANRRETSERTQNRTEQPVFAREKPENQTRRPSIEPNTGNDQRRSEENLQRQVQQQQRQAEQQAQRQVQQQQRQAEQQAQSQAQQQQRQAEQQAQRQAQQEQQRQAEQQAQRQAQQQQRQAEQQAQRQAQQEQQRQAEQQAQRQAQQQQRQAEQQAQRQAQREAQQQRRSEQQERSR